MNLNAGRCACKEADKHRLKHETHGVAEYGYSL